MAYRHITTHAVIPVPGDKQIHELVGRVNSDSDDISVAHMIAPPGWSEPAQTPSFTELTVMVRGQLSVEIDGDTLVLEAGQVLRAEPGTPVRYANTSDAPCEYYAICVPAFTPERARRDDD